MKRSHSFWSIPVLLTLVGLLLAPGALAAQGNSEAVQRCQNGGYLQYTTANGAPFKNEGQCVSYAAQEGELTSIPTASLSITYGTPADSWASVLLTGSGLQPYSTVMLSGEGNYPFSYPVGSADSNGDYSDLSYLSCGAQSSLTFSGTAADGTPVSVTEPTPC